MKSIFGNAVLMLGRAGLDLDGARGCQQSWRWSLLKLLSAEFWHLLGWSAEEMTEKTMP